MRLAQEHIQRFAGCVGMAEKEQLLHHHMDASVAGVAERDEVSHGVVLSLARNTLPHAVDVVDVELVGCSALAAGVSISRQDSLFVAAERDLRLGAFPVFVAERTALAALDGPRAVDFDLTRLAALLRPGQKRVGQAAINARTDSAARNGASLAPVFFSAPHVQHRASDGPTRKAKPLPRGLGLKCRLASTALLWRVAASRLSARLHLAWAATLDVAAVWLKAKAAIDAIYWPIISLLNHRQNVVRAHANG